MRTPAALSAVLFLLAGCMSSSAFVLGEESFAAHRPGHPIPVYDAAEDVPFTFVKVARVVASGSSHVRWHELLDALKREARAAGADALVLGRAGDDATALDGEGGTVMRRTLWALAIRRQVAKGTSPG